MDNEVDICIYLAGTGYSPNFFNYITDSQQKQEYFRHIKVHLLSLKDIYLKTDRYTNALEDFPPLGEILNY